MSLQAYESAAEAIGIDPIRQMRKSGLVVEKPIPGDSFVPYAKFAQLLEDTAAAAACPDFGLRMGQWSDEFFDGPLVLLMRHAETLQQAVTLVHRYSHVYGHGMQPRLEPVPDRPGLVDLIVAVWDADSARFVQATEFTALTVLRVLRHVCGHAHDHWTVMLPHAMASTPQRYRESFDGECRFDTPFSDIRMAASDVTAPLPGRNSLRLKMAISYIEANFRQAEEQMSAQVQRMLRQRLGMQRVMQGDIAADLSIHEKTLQRRLAKEGRAFPTLLDEVRRDVFLELLRRPARPGLAQIALMLGYSEQAALSRSCQRWFGCSPSEVLKRVRTTSPVNPVFRGSPATARA